MLVAGYGPYEQGYYAVDVTNPDASALPNGVIPNDVPPRAHLPLAAHQDARRRTRRSSGRSRRLPPSLRSSSTRATGAARNRRRDPPRRAELGPHVDGPCRPCCQRAIKDERLGPLNGYAARTKVRCWGATQTYTDPVIGRSLSIVRLDTGEILRVFMRKADYGRLPVPTPWRSRTASRHAARLAHDGHPIIYPGDVGTDDDQGLRRRRRRHHVALRPFELRSRRTGSVSSTSTSTTTRSTRARPPGPTGSRFEVTPVVSLDPSGELVLNFATGTTDNFDTTGIEYVYSVTEKLQGSTPKLRAFVNWWLGPPSFDSLAGERVLLGPMTVFNGTLYFATYAAAPPRAQVVQRGRRASGGATSSRRTIHFRSFAGRAARDAASRPTRRRTPSCATRTRPRRVRKPAKRSTSSASRPRSRQRRRT